MCWWRLTEDGAVEGLPDLVEDEADEAILHLAARQTSQAQAKPQLHVNSKQAMIDAQGFDGHVAGLVQLVVRFMQLLVGFVKLHRGAQDEHQELYEVNHLGGERADARAQCQHAQPEQRWQHNYLQRQWR